jgi:folate-binding protein YgfZ
MGADDNRHMDVDRSIAGEVALSHLGVIRARGADAVSFLQNQLTNDVASLGGASARLAGFCSAKGRMQASFIVWKATEDDVLLACAADLLAPTLKRLSMFVLRSKCKLTDASAEVPLRGRVGPAAAEGGLSIWAKQDRDDGTLIRLPDAAGLARALFAPRAAPNGPKDHASSAATSTSPPSSAPLAALSTSPGLPPSSRVPNEADALTLDTWRWLEVQSGVPTIEAATVDRFVPQMLNFELLGGVDFQKGCYPGQEVVARSQYRGTVKRRTLLFDLDATAGAAQEVFHDAEPGQPAGMVVNAAPGPRGAWSALVEVKLAALESGTLRLGSAEGTVLRRGELPYALPAA